MNPKQFLQWGGVVLVLVALLGFFNVIGPTAEDSIFGSAWWFDNGENWAHLVLGVVALLLAFGAPANLQRPIVIVLGVVGVLVGLYSLFVGEMFLGANLENPADTVLHVVVGAWALWAALKKQEEMSPMTA
ncbi:hypothetical protein HY504_01840 [Candidatus Wolfebacteria bacterium]|nr:hypothetical protein [Candidatus Wolfebacteria bacterium]